MPRRRPEARRRRRAIEWTEHDLEHLRTGGCVPLCAPTGLHPEGVVICIGGPEAAVDPEVLEAAWDDLGAEILEEWIEERPGSRPWAWWMLQAPEGRRQGEAERAYLERLGLMTHDEARRARSLAAGAPATARA